MMSRMAQKILVVDDDPAIVKLLVRHLGAAGFSVVYADNGSEGLILARESKPDLMLVDAEMPGLDGHAVCRVIKKQEETKNLPVVIMSGKLVEEKDILSGFEGGADDYVVKPFSLPVLTARLRAVLRRYEAVVKSETKLKQAGIELDASGRTVKVNGKSAELTRKEFDLLATLVAHPGRVMSVNYLLETVWGYDPADYNDPGTVEVHVSHLRKKLGPKLGKLIVNVLGHGYKFGA